MIQPALINLHANEHSKEFHYHPSAVKLDRCVGSCKTLNYWSDKVYVPNKTEDLNLSVFSMITGINELITLTKHISCECKCWFDGRKYNWDQWWNDDKCWSECKTRHVSEKYYVWNPAICICKNGKYLPNNMDDSAITYGEIIKSHDKERKTILTNFNEKKATCKTQKSYIVLAFSLTTIAILIYVSIHCYLIKHQAKQGQLLPFQFTNNKLRM